jgi:3-deoxy-D-manno-octulosonic-acid transferase
MHAASVGEVSVAAVVAEELIKYLPDCAIVVSTATETGQAFAKNIFSKTVTLIYAPFDSSFSVKRALSFVRPDVLICIETEIWPNLLFEAHQMGVKTVLINGRISDGSVKWYLKFSSLMKKILETMEAFSMIHKNDAERIFLIGANEKKVTVNGNAKFDILIRNHHKCCIDKIRKSYSLNGDEVILVAGSTRRNEEKAVLDAYEKIIEIYPETYLFIAPRHIKRAKQVADIVKDRGLKFQFRSDFDGNSLKRIEKIVIINTIGELFSVYGVCALAFCGGSLVPLGGQNLLEAAVWGKPVFYGPFMDDFQEAKTLLEDAVGDCFLVKSGDELAKKSLFYLQNPEERINIGRQARAAVMNNQGAAEKHAGVVFNVLNNRGFIP